MPRCFTPTSIKIYRIFPGQTWYFYQMTYFIGYESALDILIWENSYSSRYCGGHPCGFSKTRATPKGGKRPDSNLLQSALLPSQLRSSDTVHVCIGEDSVRSRACGLSCHVWTGPKHGSFFGINDEFCVSTPEACFIQMAGSLPLIHLIELGFLLCGTYAPSAVDLPMTCGLQPLTSLSRLNNYIDRCGGESGVVNARRALKYVRNGSASVMETKLTMLLCLPRMLGGIGLPLPELNAEILIPSNLTGRTLTNVRRPDLFWPDRNVAVEYDSNEYHSVAERVVEDSRRKKRVDLMWHSMPCCALG